VVVTDYFNGSKTPENERFVKAFQAKYNRLPENFAALGYTSVYVVASVLKTAGPNPSREVIRDAMTKVKDLPVPLGTGRFSFDANRSGSYEGVISVIRDGKFTLPQ
jgi:branched-chain amino acid transport system substrate-binding protein